MWDSKRGRGGRGGGGLLDIDWQNAIGQFVCMGVLGGWGAMIDP